MITGFNTDVEYEGRVYHVQTEDKGSQNPVVESLVYSGGEIVGSRRVSYVELVQSSEASEEEVLRRMEGQHQTLIREIRSGRFDPEGPRPYGSLIVSNQSLDEVVLSFLARESAAGRIRIEVTGQEALEEGSKPPLRVRVVAETSNRPVPGARVALKMISTLDRSQDLFCGETDPEGWVEAVLDLPVLQNGRAAILCQAEVGDSSAETQHLLRKREASPGT